MTLILLLINYETLLDTLYIISNLVESTQFYDNNLTLMLPYQDPEITNLGRLSQQDYVTAGAPCILFDGAQFHNTY